jgi:8-oxo-dGTP pyrophosphatase MutT (NUDIX family)
MKLLELQIPHSDPESRVIGAGVLIYAIHEKKVWFLLGKETNDNRYGVFGGRLHPNTTIQANAVREFNEETMGVVLARDQIASILAEKKYTLKFCGAAGLNRYFVTYMVQIPYDALLKNKFATLRRGILNGTLGHTLPECYDSITGQLKHDFMEKRDICWFLAADILNIALRARWNHPVNTLSGSPMFRRPFLSGLHSLMLYFNLEGFLRDLAWTGIAAPIPEKVFMTHNLIVLKDTLETRSPHSTQPVQLP